MPERSSKPKRPRDLNQLAAAITEAATESEPTPTPEQPPKNEHAAALGRLGGKKGGAARAKALTPEQRREIARKAAAARWKPITGSTG
jgi:hypothetical protein